MEHYFNSDKLLIVADKRKNWPLRIGHFAPVLFWRSAVWYRTTHRSAISTLCCFVMCYCVTYCFNTVLFWHCAVLTLCCFDAVLFWHCAVLTLCCSDAVLFWCCTVLTLCCFGRDVMTTLFCCIPTQKILYKIHPKSNLKMNRNIRVSSFRMQHAFSGQEPLVQIYYTVPFLVHKTPSTL